jgi:hypothetical protein
MASARRRKCLWQRAAYKISLVGLRESPASVASLKFVELKHNLPA